MGNVIIMHNFILRILYVYMFIQIIGTKARTTVMKTDTDIGWSRIVSTFCPIKFVSSIFRPWRGLLDTTLRRLSWSILFAACRPLVSFKYIRVPPKIMEDSGLYTWDHISLPRKTVECVLIYIRRLHVTIWLKRYITITSKIQPIPFFHISWSAPLLFQVMGGGYPLGGRGQVIRRKLDSGSSEWIPRFERATLVQC